MLLARRAAGSIHTLTKTRGATFSAMSAVAANGAAAAAREKYRNWSREELEERLAALEQSQARASLTTAASSSSQRPTSSRERRKAEKIRRRTEAPDFRPTSEGSDDKKKKKFDITSYPCRKIALRFSYDGTPYNGLATQQMFGKNATRDSEADMEPSSDVLAVEDVLWKALCATRLVGEDDRMSDVHWTRCGRTDRGVSSGGQVVSLWVRSRKMDQWKERREFDEFVAIKKQEQGVDSGEGVEDEVDVKISPEEAEQRLTTTSENGSDDGLDDRESKESKRIEADPESEELPYVSNLNSVLPPTIRIQAWSPVRPHFSARFDCRYRHYKYFFTSGCPFIDRSTTKGPVTRLDIPLMQFAAQKFLGEHDFRSFCKVDPSKQIDNYRRRVDGISIDEVKSGWQMSQEDSGVSAIGSSNGHADQNGEVDDDGKKNILSEKMYVLNLRGTAFLYHQVRHMMAVLFLIGSGLEKATIIDELLNVEKGGVARDRWMMRRRGLELKDDEEESRKGIRREMLQTTLPDSTATTMGGMVASDDFENNLANPATPDSVKDQFNPREKALLLEDEISIYDRKPEYEMASDRPLMLWECGFRETDVQWRSGTYDGSLASWSSSEDGDQRQRETSIIHGDVNSPSAMTASVLHSTWSSLLITSEMYRHFLLALPLDKSSREAGYIPASNLFPTSTHPSLHKATIPSNPLRAQWQGAASSSYNRKIVPLGDGKFKPLVEYKGLINAKRERTPGEKNAKFLETKGKKRAERNKEQQSPSS